MDILKYLTILCFFVVSCGEKESDDSETKDEPTHALSFGVEEFEVHAGSDVVLGIFDRETRKVVKVDQTSIVDGSATFSYPDLIKAGHAYYLSYYVDVNGNEKCDKPPVDHGWVLKVDTVENDLVIVDKHRMSFSDPCDNMADHVVDEDDVVVTLTGSLSVSSDVSDAEGLTAGQSLAGATVFVKGFPNQEATTDSSGNFSLAVNVGANFELAAAKTDMTVLMWYTKFQDGKGSFDWSAADYRLGATTSINFDSGKLETDLGNLSLKYTSGTRFRVLSSADLESPVSGCTISLPGMDFQLVVTESESHEYWIDYLPPGEYTFSMSCSGLPSWEQNISIAATNGFEETSLMDDIVRDPQ